MTQRAHSFPAEAYSTHPEDSYKNHHVVWQPGALVNDGGETSLTLIPV